MLEVTKYQESELFFVLNWISCFYIFVLSWYRIHRFAQNFPFCSHNILKWGPSQ